MKLLKSPLLHGVIVIAVLLASPVERAVAKTATGADQSGDPGWPREKYSNGTRLIIYQPQVDDWKNFQELTWRMAVSLTPKGGKETVGVVEMKGNTDVDNVSKVVVITNPEVTGTYFPSLDQATKEKMEQSFKTFVPPTISISLHRLIASVPKQEAPAGVQLNNEPPKIFVGYRPSILLNVDGEPVLSEVPKTNLKFVVNTQWPLFFDGENSSYYVPVGQQWLTSNSLNGQWSPTKKLPRDMSKVPQDKEWSALKKVIPPPTKSGGITPVVFYSDKPAEVILFDGQPVYAQIPGTQLTYATNTDSVVFVFTPTQQFYYLTAGRWFSAMDLQGPWTYATSDLPADFAKIPPSSPASAILASVPGTDEAKDAVLLAQVPTTMTIKPAEAQAKVKVEYGGDPKFEPIKGTSMAYATNTQDKVIKVGDVSAICTPVTTAMFIRTPVTAGRSTTTEVGIRWTSLRLRPIGVGRRTRSSGPAPETLTPIERARVATIEAARKQAARVVAAATIVQVEAATVGPRNATTCSARRRIGRGADRRANASKTFSGAAVIDGAAAEASDGVDAVEAGADDDN